MRALFGNRVWAVVVLFVFGVVLFGCKGDDIFSLFLSGQANFPTQFAKGPLGELVPVANTPFQVVDLALRAGDDVVASGTTDNNGNYNAQVLQTSSAAVIVLGEVRVSGLIDTRQGSAVKVLNGVTDIACEAGISAVGDGSITDEQLDAGRIANLELAADQILEEMSVDFTDADGSRSAAVAEVRRRTNDGAVSP